ncbi:MAG: N-acetylmuramoyl-L-alanine amidase [Sphingomonas sp.]
MAFALTWLPDVLKAAGLNVEVQPGWETRGIGDMGIVRGVMCHHTAGPATGNMPCLGVITNGRPDLRGPLSQLGLGRDGTYYVIAAGKAQHAGKGRWQGVTTGNTNFIGIEAENRGIAADPWPAVQMDAYRRGVAAILGKIGVGAIMCCGHKEYALPLGRKSDPSFDMIDFRARVAALLTGIAPAPSPDIGASPDTGESPRPVLRRGARGAFAKELQAKLGLPEDGIFGPNTETKVRAFQQAQGLTADGVVGAKSWAALDAAFP